MPNFEVFKKRTPPPPAQATITIQGRGILSLNRTAYDLLGHPKAVELLFDPAERIMGLRAVDVAGEDSYPLRSAGKTDTTFLVSAVAFTKYYDLPRDSSRRYEAYMDGDVLCVNMSEPGEVVSSNRKGTGRKAAAVIERDPLGGRGIAILGRTTDRFGQPVVRRTRGQEPEEVHSVSGEDS